MRQRETIKPIAAALVVLCVTLGGSGQAEAAPIINNFGLSSPSSTVTFDEIVFPEGTVVDNQYAAFGVVFAPGLRYDSQSFPLNFPGVSGHYLGNNLFPDPPPPEP